MNLLKRDKIVVFLLITILIIVCCGKFVMSIQAEENPFDENDISTWNNHFVKFQEMKIEDINRVWANASKDMKLQFLNKYLARSNIELEDLKLEGFDNKNLKFFKLDDQLFYGDENSKVNLNSLPNSLDKITYSMSSTDEGDLKFSLDFKDGSKVSLSKGQISNLITSNPGEFKDYNKLQFKDNNGQIAELYTSGKDSDIDINKDGTIEMKQHSAVKTGLNYFESTVNRPYASGSASLKMIDDSHLIISNVVSDTYRGKIFPPSDSSSIGTDIFFDDQETSSKQFVRLTSHELELSGNGIGIQLNEDVLLGRELQKITADGKQLSVNLYGVPISFDEDKTSVPNIPVIDYRPGEINKIESTLQKVRGVELVNLKDDSTLSYQVGVKGEYYTRYDVSPAISAIADFITSIVYSIPFSQTPGINTNKGTVFGVIPDLNGIERSDDYLSNFKYPQPVLKKHNILGLYNPETGVPYKNLR